MVAEILMNDGERVCLCDDRDILEVIEHYCGYDFKKFIERILENEDAQEEIDALQQELDASDSCNDYLRDKLLEIQDVIDEYLINLDRGNAKFLRKQVIPMLENIKNSVYEVL